jgi:hypothetical protein
MICIANSLKTLRQACWVLLLALYAAAALKVDSIHELLHAREFAELHSIEQENNPCHKSIYHQEAERGCEHQSHITENTKCPLCEYSSSADELLTCQRADSDEVVTTSLLIFACDDIPLTRTLAHADRGPPTIA